MQPLVTGRLAVLGAALLVVLTLAAAAHARNPQIAGLQVALRAHRLYGGPIDGILGAETRRATKTFQRRAGLVVDGLAGPRTRRALGRLGRPLFGRRTLRRRMVGWDVSVLQFLLARRAEPLTVDGHFGPATYRALRSYQRRRGLSSDGIAGPQTMKALALGRAAVMPARVRTTHASVRALVELWARRYGLDPGLVRALAWHESGYQPQIVSPAGARGVMQVLPVTKQYVETVLLHRRVPWTVEGGIEVGVVYLRQLLREFWGSERLALAAWYQGPASVRRHGQFRATRHFVANVLALRHRGV
jgi:lysozyme family protein